MNRRTTAIATTALTLGVLLAACTGNSSTSSERPSVSSSSESVSAPPTLPSSSSSEKRTVTQTVTEVPPPSVASSSSTPEMPGGFVGTWYGYSRTLVVRSDGSLKLTFRLYIPCTADRLMGCDRVHGNDIEDGGKVVAQLTQVINSNTVFATITQTSVPDTSPLGPVRIGHDLRHHALAIFGGGFNGEPFCGDRSPPGYCGA